MTRHEDKAKLRRQLEDRLADADRQLGSRLDAWDRRQPGPDFTLRSYPAGTGISTVGRDGRTPAKVHTAAAAFTWSRRTTSPRGPVPTVCGTDFPILAVYEQGSWPVADDCAVCRRVINARLAKLPSDV